MRAGNACGYGNYGNILSIVAAEQGPPHPTNCIAARQGTSSPHPVLITWDYGTTVVDGFRIARLGPGGDPATAPDSAWNNVGGDLPSSPRQYTDSANLVAGQTYWYRVRAYRNTPCGRVYSTYSNYDGANP